MPATIISAGIAVASKEIASPWITLVPWPVVDELATLLTGWIWLGSNWIYGRSKVSFGGYKAGNSRPVYPPWNTKRALGWLWIWRQRHYRYCHKDTFSFDAFHKTEKKHQLILFFTLYWTTKLLKLCLPNQIKVHYLL